jgi:hypothetical protein
VYAAQILVQALLDVLLVVAGLEVLDMGQAGAGWLSAAWRLGSLGGGAVALLLLRSGRLAGRVARGALLAGLPMIAIGVWAAAAQALGLPRPLLQWLRPFVSGCPSCRQPSAAARRGCGPDLYGRLRASSLATSGGGMTTTARGSGRG